MYYKYDYEVAKPFDISLSIQKNVHDIFNEYCKTM